MKIEPIIMNESEYNRLRETIDASATFYGYDGYDGFVCSEIQNRKEEAEKIKKLAAFLKAEFDKKEKIRIERTFQQNVRLPKSRFKLFLSFFD